jgi:hypothetical protein
MFGKKPNESKLYSGGGGVEQTKPPHPRYATEQETSLTY